MKRRTSHLNKTTLKRIFDQAQISNADAVNISLLTGEKVEIILNKEKHENQDTKINDNFTL